MGVSAPKGDRGAPLESPPQREPGGSRRSLRPKGSQRSSEEESPLQRGSKRSLRSKGSQRGSKALQKSQGRGSIGVSFPRAPLLRAPVEPGGLQKEYPPQVELEGFREDPLLQKEAEQP